MGCSVSEAPTGTPNEAGVPDGTTHATKWAKPGTTQRGRERPKSPQKQENQEKRKEESYRERKRLREGKLQGLTSRRGMKFRIREWKFCGKNPNGRDTLRVAVERRLNRRDRGSK